MEIREDDINISGEWDMKGVIILELAEKGSLWLSLSQWQSGRPDLGAWKGETHLSELTSDRKVDHPETMR
ncbi:MAG: hypothetical protein ACE5IO_04855 [Thermoplasmata archaeon]